MFHQEQIAIHPLQKDWRSGEVTDRRARCFAANSNLISNCIKIVSFENATWK